MTRHIVVLLVASACFPQAAIARDNSFYLIKQVSSAVRLTEFRPNGRGACQAVRTANFQLDTVSSRNLALYRAAVSPTGKWLAFGLTSTDADWDRASLTIIDLKKLVVAFQLSEHNRSIGS